MKRRGCLGFACIAAVFAAGLAWVYFLYWRPSPSSVPAEALFPPYNSVAFRVRGFRSAFDRHWAARGRDDTNAAVEELLKTLGVWDPWIRDYGESGARARIAAYRRAVFELLGRETWLIFGEWAAPGLEGAGEVGLMLYLSQDTPIKSRIGPLADLILPGHKIRTSTYRRQKIFEYIDAEDRRSMEFVNLGGWVCVSLRNPGGGTIHRVIDQFLDRGSPMAEGKGLEASAPREPPIADADSAVSGLFRPAKFWGQLRRFNMQRERAVGEKSELKLIAWTRRLEGIDTVSLRQSGRSLLNFDLKLRGGRIDLLDRVLTQTPSESIDLIVKPVHEVRTLYPTLAQVDLSRPFAVGGLPLLGIDWEKLIDDIKDAKWIGKTMARALGASVLVDEPPSGGRVGLAFYAKSTSPLPFTALWIDEPPVLRTNHSPADAWRMIDRSRIRAEGDRLLITGTAVSSQATTTSLSQAQRALADRTWTRAEAPPLAFAVLHFDELLGFMQRFPTIFLHEDDRARWDEYESLVHGLQLALGSVAFTLERRDQELTLSSRTLELEENETPITTHEP